MLLLKTERNETINLEVVEEFIFNGKILTIKKEGRNKVYTLTEASCKVLSEYLESTGVK